MLFNRLVANFSPLGLMTPTLMILFVIIILHQVMVAQSDDESIEAEIRKVIQTFESNGPCLETALPKPVRACIEVFRAEERQINETMKPGEDGYRKSRCHAGWKKNLCYFDIVCKWCSNTTAVSIEVDVKADWSDKDGQFKRCLPWFHSFEYSHSRRCYPNSTLTFPTQAESFWNIWNGLYIISGILLICLCVGCGIYWFTMKKSPPSTKNSQKSGRSGRDGGGQDGGRGRGGQKRSKTKTSAVDGNKQSAIKSTTGQSSGIKSTVAKSAVKSTVKSATKSAIKSSAV